MIYEVGTDADPVKCQYCGKMLYFIRTAHGRLVPVNEDGSGHRCARGKNGRSSNTVER